VAKRAIRRVALEVFRHLHSLSLRFHLERQTGGVSRDIERGTRGISSLLSYMLFSIIPVILEFTLVAVVLLKKFDWRFAAVTFGPSHSINGLTIIPGADARFRSDFPTP
jgi:ATP-binding cassette subfamily B protein